MITAKEAMKIAQIEIDKQNYHDSLEELAEIESLIVQAAKDGITYATWNSYTMQLNTKKVLQDAGYVVTYNEQKPYGFSESHYDISFIK